MRIASLALLLIALPVVAEETARTLLDKGVKAFARKDYARAQAYLEAARNKDAKCHDASYYLGQIHAAKGKLYRAAKELARVPKEHPLFPLAQGRLGQIHLKRGKKEAALKCMLASAELRASANMWMQVADVQMQLKKFKDAARSLDAADRMAKGDFRVVEMRGRLFVETKQYRKALDCYDKMLEKFRDDYTLHNMRGLCLRELDRNEEAARAFERVLKLYPYHKGSMRNLIRLWEGDASKAARVAELEKKLERIEKYPPNIRKVKRRR
ncbi:MAG: tetratricopeptide repeat protein [Planctomycetota bacterium]|jgi:tetratricopeptide (TPR) repeat protein